MYEEHRLLAIGQLKQQCCEPLICKQHGDPLPCNLCDGESSSIVCNKCQREISQLPLDLKSHEHPCQSVEIYRSEGKIIFETDPQLEAEYLRKEQEIRLALEHAENEKRRLEREAEERNRIQREREAAERNRVQRERDEAERERIRHEREIEAATQRAREAAEIERQRLEIENKARKQKLSFSLLGTAIAIILIYYFKLPVTSPPSEPKTIQACNGCPEMVLIPAGSFMMGSSSAEQDSQADEKPRHEVSIAGFAMARHEVTRQQFGAFVDDTGYSAGNSCWTYESGKYEEHSGRNWQSPAFSQGTSHPVVCVSAQDAEAYIRWLNNRTGKTYRLPTEAEWEYAARAGTQTARYWGDDADQACAYANVADQTAKQQISFATIHNCADGYIYTAPVGSFRANAFGLYDMLGNVREWTCSAYTVAGYNGSEKTCTNSANSSLRVLRGGSWYHAPAGVRSAFRDRFPSTDRNSYMGFRLAQDIGKPLHINSHDSSTNDPIKIAKPSTAPSNISDSQNVQTATTPSPIPPLEKTIKLVEPDIVTIPSNELQKIETDNGTELIAGMIVASIQNDEATLNGFKQKIIELPRPKHGDRKLARKLNEQGLALSATNNYNDAISLFEKAVELDSADPEIMNNLAYALHKNGNFRAALTRLNSTILLDPQRVNAWSGLGFTYAMLNDSDKSKACFANAYRMSKNPLRTHEFFLNALDEETNTYVQSILETITSEWEDKHY